MHPCLNVDEILRLLACELVVSGAKVAIVALACCCKSFEDPVLDALWETQDQLTPLLRCLPQEVWKEDGGSFVSQLIAFVLSVLNCLIRKSFKRIPTKAEWTHFRKHTRRMRNLKVDATKNLVTSGVLSALQLRTANEPLLPRLGSFECQDATGTLIPFIPLFLSPKTINITITFSATSRTVMVASTIAQLSTLCPYIRFVALHLPRDPVIVDAVSGMLLACNRDTLQAFLVDSPLTGEAREVLYKLPRLSHVWMVVHGPISLPPLKLPRLRGIKIEYDHNRGWLQGFRGATLGKLKSVTFRATSMSAQIGDFLEDFQGVALTASAQNTLSAFRFHCSQPWNPNYSSLLAFRQLTVLEIEFSCHDVCSSKVDDDIIVSLTQAMPKLEILRLGGIPCRSLTGVTFKGLVVLACRCLQLSKLRIHLQANSLAEVITGTEPPTSSEHITVVPGTHCALTDLQVGGTPILSASRTRLTIALVLLQIFPRILNIEYTNPQWKGVAETIETIRKVGCHVYHASKTHPPRLQ